RSAATPDITVDVTAASTGNAVLGADFNFTTQTLTFPAGSANNTQSFQVAVINNTSSQPTRYAVFQLTNAVGATINSSANSNTHILYIKDDDQTPTTASKAIEFQYTSSYQVGTAGSASAEIVAHDPGTQRLFVVNSIQNRLEILNFSNPAAITAVSSIDMSTYGAGVNSVAVKNGVVAVAVEGTTVATATTAVPGKVVFLDTNGALISQVNVGVQPDMVGFSPDGKTVMTADEGEPNANYSFDPQGSISIIDLSNGAAGLQQSSVSVLNFNAYDAQIASLRSQGIRIYGPNATVSQDFEPEYVTFSNDSRKAWVVLQENNAMVAIDVVNKQITSIFPLGLKDHSISANSFDASDRVSNNQVIPVNWPVKGMLQPDGIAYFEIAGTPYIIGANEGDSRAWTGGSGFPG
ncbi:MAG: choice-of-anchor I domain-containing protein, partial [Cytophagales bacterium]